MKKRLIALISVVMLAVTPITTLAAESPTVKPIEKDSVVAVFPEEKEKDFIKICLCVASIGVVVNGIAVY